MQRRHQLRHDSVCDSKIVDITSALLVQWILNPSSRDFDLRDLTVITAMTGEEHERTRRPMDIGNPGYQNLLRSPCGRTSHQEPLEANLTSYHLGSSAFYDSRSQRRRQHSDTGA